MTLHALVGDGSEPGTCEMVEPYPDYPAEEYAQISYFECDFEDVAVNMYTAEVNVIGGYYDGSAEDVLVVFDPSLGFTTAGGWF